MATEGPLHLVVFGDSTAFLDDVGPQLPGVPHLYPNVLGSLLEADLGRDVRVTMIVRAGLTVRDAWRIVTKDRHAMFDVLATADLLVVGIGSFDNAPGGIPPIVDAVTPFVRQPGLRRRLRKAAIAAYPWAVKATGGRRRRTPPAVFEDLYDKILMQLRGLTQGVPTVVLGPTSHRADYYAHRHPAHEAAQAHQFAIAVRHNMPTVAVWPLVEPFADQLNPDGIHWPAPAHAAVAAAALIPLLAQLHGELAKPVPPGS